MLYAIDIGIEQFKKVKNLYNFLNSIMPEKVPCKFHSGEYITNFCNRVQCLVELCPSCVCSHSERHERLRTLPSYEPIDETIKDCQKIINSQKQQIRKAEKLMNDYQKDWQLKKQAIILKLQKAKQQSITTVTNVFDELKKSYQEKIQEEQRNIEKKYGGKFENLAECCKSEERDLLYYEGELKKSYSSHFIKPLYTEIIPKCQQTMKRLNRDFSNLSKNQIQLDYRKPKLLNDIRNIVVDSIALELAYYEDQQDEFDQGKQNIMINTSATFPYKQSSPNIIQNRVMSPNSTIYVQQTRPYMVSKPISPSYQPSFNPIRTSPQPWRVYQ